MPVRGRLPVGASEFAVLTSANRLSGLRMSELAGMVVYGPPATKHARSSMLAALVPYLRGPTMIPKMSLLAGVGVYRTGVPDLKRSRSWWFTLDGHTFYVLDLAEEGTFVYDTTTQQWSRWYTAGFDGTWNMKTGTMWGGTRIVAGDSISGQTWVIDPGNPMDEGWRTMEHVVTGGIMLRGRVYVGMSSLNITGSAGQITSDDGTATLSMRFSDDMGKTWSDGYPLVVAQGDFEDETAWRSLGSFCNPGRLIEISDDGGMIRIDGLDANLDGFDEPPAPATGVKRG